LNAIPKAPPPRRLSLGTAPLVSALARTWLCWSLLGTCGIPALVAAQDAAPSSPGERDKLARTRFEQGRDAYRDGRYRDAWALFHEAYQLSGRPELLYNIGQAADRLGQDSEALQAFDMYLQQLPAASNRHDVENRVRALKERVGGSKQQAPEVLSEEPAPASGSSPAWAKSEGAGVPPAPPPPNGHPERQGFYLRGALGFGLRHDGISGDATGSLTGAGLSLDLAAGYAILPGFVLGGGVFFDGTSSPSIDGVKNAGGVGSANLTTIGPFVDFYPRRETQGIHLQGVLGVSVLSFGGPNGSDISPSGIATLLGAGYEWPIAGDVSVGVLGRLSLALLSKDSVSHAFASPSLLASISWF
jgi:hypothetical protein